MSAIKTVTLVCDAEGCRTFLHTDEMSETTARVTAAQEHGWSMIIQSRGVRADLCSAHSMDLKATVLDQ